MALLLWGLRTVRIGISEGWGSDIRSVLGASLNNRFKAVLSGLGITMLLQSSSATALLTSSFSGQGILTTATALAIMLGADVGTTLVAQVLTFDLSAMSPVLIAVGVAMYTYSQGGRSRDIGRLLLGLGMMLLALKLIVAASLPMRESVIIQQIFLALGEDLILAVIFGAIIAWASHSSLATVLLVITMVSTNAIEITVAFAFVLGANVGGAIPPFVATLSANRAARQPPLGNLLFRLVGVIAVLPFLSLVAIQMSVFDVDNARQIANFHMFFNLALMIIFFPFIGQMVKLTEAMLPEDESGTDPMLPRELDRGAFETPLVALVNTEREVLRMGEVVERMLRNTFTALKRDDKELARQTRELDSVVNDFYDSVKRYLTELAREPLGSKESRRCNEILAYATDLEHIGDIISDDLIQNIVQKKIATRSRMSPRDSEDIDDLQGPILDSFQLSLSVFTSGDVTMARNLLAGKYKFGKREKKAVRNHLQQIREESAYDSDLSAMQLDVLRDLKRVSSHLASVAYPILDDAGHLRSRLRGKKKDNIEKEAQRPIDDNAKPSAT